MARINLAAKLVPPNWHRGEALRIYTGKDAEPYCACVRLDRDHAGLEHGWIVVKDPLQYNEWVRWWFEGTPPARFLVKEPTKPSPFAAPPAADAAREVRKKVELGMNYGTENPFNKSTNPFDAPKPTQAPINPFAKPPTTKNPFER